MCYNGNQVSGLMTLHVYISAFVEYQLPARLTILSARNHSLTILPSRGSKVRTFAWKAKPWLLGHLLVGGSKLQICIITSLIVSLILFRVTVLMCLFAGPNWRQLDSSQLNPSKISVVGVDGDAQCVTPWVLLAASDRALPSEAAVVFYTSASTTTQG